VQWLSIARLNGGKLLEAYRPGFPFPLLFARPVRTFVLVGVPMAYDAVSGVVLYLPSALLLQGLFGAPFPLLPIAVWIAAVRLMQTAVQWATVSRVIQWIASIAGTALVVGVPLMGRHWSTQIDFSLAEYAFVASTGLASFGLTVVGVARQRRGDAGARWPRPVAVASSAHHDWFTNLFRLPCPTSSATRAQVWFELKSSGLFILAIGAAGALLHPILFAVGGPVTLVRGFAVIWAVLCLPAVLWLGGNAFGIRWKRGRVYATAFMATQACGTARLATLKVLVRTTCMLVALTVVGVSLWTSSSLVSGWGKAAPGWLRIRHTIGTAIGALTGYELIALIVVAALLVAMMVTARASLAALRACYPRHLTIATWILLLYGLASVARPWAGRYGFEALLAGVSLATPWMLTATIAAATVYLSRACLREQLLTLPHVGGAILVTAAFGAAGVALLGAAGLELTRMTPANTAWMVSLALLPLTTGLLAPWSLSRVRHA
jgi:hypothetical protein